MKDAKRRDNQDAGHNWTGTNAPKPVDHQPSDERAHGKVENHGTAANVAKRRRARGERPNLQGFRRA